MLKLAQKAIILFTIAISSALYAQTGTITGIITDGRDSTNKPIFGAQVFIEGTTHGAFTGPDGSYTFGNVPEGKYDITVSYVLIGNQKIENVRVNAGQTTTANYAMGASQVEEAGIKIVLKKNKESETAAVNEMKNSAEVQEIVSNKEMSDKGFSKASDAAKSVTGVSIVEGKYAYIRGLSDRYSKTMVNGSEIPGLNPDRNAVELDLYPSAFIQSMNVVKTFSPDLPGDFAGGLINIKTRESYDSLTFKISGGVGYNPQANLQSNFASYEGSSTDFLGFDNGYRDFSEQIITAIENDNFPTEITRTEAQANNLANFTSSMNGVMNVNRMNSPLDHNLTFSMGNTINIARKKDTLLPNQKFAYFAGINYRRNYDYFNGGNAGRFELENQTSIFNDSTDSPFLEIRRLEYEQGQMSVQVGGLFGAYYRFNPNNKVSFRYLHNHSGDRRALFSEGFNQEIDGAVFRTRVLEYLERQVNTFQLSGEHSFDSLLFHTPTDFEWTSSYSKSSQDQPDLRVFNDDLKNGIYSISPNYLQPTRFSRSMSQHTADFRTHFTKKFKTDSSEIKLKTGLSYTYKHRNFQELQITYNELGASYQDFNGDVDRYFSDETFGIVTTTSQGQPRVGQFFRNTTSPDNTFFAYQSLIGYYLMGDLPLSKKLNLITGARLEQNYMYTETDDNDSGEINELSILPSFNLSYTFFKNRFKENKLDSTKFSKQDLKLQFVYYNTVARPSFREFTPVLFDNFLAGWREVGNSNIRQTSIHNFDLRLEFYPNSGELLAFSMFYKNFRDGIELSVNPGTPETEITWRNSDGDVYGIEAEFRRSLSFISDKLDAFKIGLNASLMYSSTAISERETTSNQQFNPAALDSRPFFGQSPYLVNSLLQYKNDSIGITSTITFNQFGTRLALIQTNGTPHIFEKGRGELNFNISKQISPRSKITFRARNLINPEYKWVYQFNNIDEESLRVQLENNPDWDVDSFSANYERFQEGEYIFKSFKKGRDFSISYSYTF